MIFIMFIKEMVIIVFYYISFLISFLVRAFTTSFTYRASRQESASTSPLFFNKESLVKQTPICIKISCIKMHKKFRTDIRR